MDVIEKLQESTKEEAHSSEEVLEAWSVEKENEVLNPRAEGKIEGTHKRKEADSKEKFGEESKTKIKKANEVADEGNDSPSSPLHLSSAGADHFQ